MRSPQIFFFFSCQTRISRYRNEPAWSSEIARIGRKLGVGSDPSKCTLFKGYGTEASSLRLQKVHLARQRAEGKSRNPAPSARSRAESRAPGAASAGCWSILPPILTPSGPGFSEQSYKFTGGDQEPSETIALQAACGEYPRAGCTEARNCRRVGASPNWWILADTGRYRLVSAALPETLNGARARERVGEERNLGRAVVLPRSPNCRRGRAPSRA